MIVSGQEEEWRVLFPGYLDFTRDEGIVRKRQYGTMWMARAGNSVYSHILSYRETERPGRRWDFSKWPLGGDAESLEEQHW